MRDGPYYGFILQGGDMELNSGELLSSYIKTLTDEVAKTVREENKVLKDRIDDMQNAIDRIKQWWREIRW